jgi:hypothetical protein
MNMFEPLCFFQVQTTYQEPTKMNSLYSSLSDHMGRNNKASRANSPVNRVPEVAAISGAAFQPSSNKRDLANDCQTLLALQMQRTSQRLQVQKFDK